MWENTFHEGFSLLNLPIFQFSLGFLFLVDLRVVLEHFFICIEEISVLYAEIEISLLLRKRLKLKSRFVLSVLIS